MTVAKTLVIGGARSGKSRLAEQLATESGMAVIYIATATPGDEEMAARIAAHRAHRPPSWETVEEPVSLAAALREHAAPERCLIVDCVTLWLTNVLLTTAPGTFARERAALFDTLPGLPGRLIMVTNETGLGIVPLGVLSRRFADEAGWLNQELAAACDEVLLTVAGLPLTLKGNA